MSCVLGSLIDAEALQSELNTQFVNFDPTQTQDAIGVLMFIKSPSNTGNVIQQQIDTGDGHLRTVRLTYDARLDEDDVTATSIQSCAGGSEMGNCSHDYTLDPAAGVSYAWTMTLSRLITTMKNNPTWIAKQFQKVMDALDRRIDKLVITDIASNFGNFATTSYDFATGAASSWAGTTNFAQVRTKKGGYKSGDWNPRFITQVKSEFQKLNYNGAPVVFGDNELDAFFTEYQASCCSDSGETLSEVLRLKPIAYMRDEYVEGIIGANEFIGIAPGAIQLLEFLQFRGAGNVFSSDIYSQGTIMNPRSGNEYDFLMKFDCGVWTFQIKKAFDVAYLPTNIADTGDKLSGVNWVNNFKIVNPDECDPCES